MSEVEEFLKNILEKYAKSQQFKLNPDKERVDWIIKNLIKNEEKYGFKYCPCRAVTGDMEEDRKIICPCTFHKKEIKEQGHCLCRLFTSEDFKNK